MKTMDDKLTIAISGRLEMRWASRRGLIDHVHGQIAARFNNQFAGLIWTRRSLAIAPARNSARLDAIALGEDIDADGGDVFRKRGNFVHAAIYPHDVDLRKRFVHEWLIALLHGANYR